MDSGESDDPKREGRQFAEALAAVVGLLREGRGWSREDLADEASLHRTHIGLVERAERHLSVEAAFQITRAFEMPLSELMALTERFLAERRPEIVTERALRAADEAALVDPSEVERRTGLHASWVTDAITETYSLLDVIDDRLVQMGSPPLSQLVELANLSSMIGNLLGAGLAHASRGAYVRNRPHTYPDLVAQQLQRPDIEIKTALESNKPKGHLPKAGLHFTFRYVLGTRDGTFQRKKENRGDTAWIWEVRFGDLAEDDFSISNTAGDSGKTAVVKTPALDRMSCVLFEPRFNPYARPRPSHSRK